jgi:SNF2 family DNA or RNA helicase
MARAPQIVMRDAKGKPKYKNLEKLNKLIAPHSFRVLKSECLDLPEKIYKTAYFDLTAEQRRVYNKAEEEGRLTLNGEDTPFNRLVVLGKLAQITSGYYLHPDATEPVRIEGGSPKLELLKERVQAVLEEDRKVIIWARYHVELKDICDALLDIGLDPGIGFVQYHGKVSKKERDLAIDTFEHGNAYVFVGQQQAGGTGITLVAASTVIYFSNTFSLGDRLQSEDRAHRIGQRENVVYINLVARGTIDEKIVDAVETKKNISEITLAFSPKKSDNSCTT